MKKKNILRAVFIIGLIYIVIPGPSSIREFSAIPNSLKSDEPGDTVEVPEIAAYFSQYDRAMITKFYKDDFRHLFIFGRIFPPIILNHPPEMAKIYVRDQLFVTFLEEYVYPLKGSIFVGGYEPYVENEMKKGPHSFVGDNVHIDGNYYISKTTLRLYPANLFFQLVVYLGIWLSAVCLFKLWGKVYDD